MMDLKEWEAKYSNLFWNTETLKGCEVPSFDVVGIIETGHSDLLISAYFRSGRTVFSGNKKLQDHLNLRNALKDILPDEYIARLDAHDASNEIDFSVLQIAEEFTIPTIKVTAPEEEINEKAIETWLNCIVNEAVNSIVVEERDALVNACDFVQNLGNSPLMDI